ncbi:helix-turn-helix domain-containing protein [Rubrimonas cliftonensis]|uniref:Transcriptional regulator, XRE family with cupin sensor n=1 Tax=Rubrimonas cliftonensis TaxID=89524 RepID=A0A1H4CEP0_9RHOB|nr:XRE family transcriptional regulator [Rubrimonas cliftonensis]SEA58783.1 transcriptional regulator, XRE family with cupin sensor [Rubrimonas cliftonensis]
MDQIIGEQPEVSPPREPQPKELEAWIGAQVREMRTALGMTMSELAKSASLSVGMLSKIENGQTSPSLNTLQNLAQALNIPLASFFTKYDDKREASYVRSGEGLTIERRGSRSGHVYQLLGASLRNKVRLEPYLITLTGDSDAYPIFQHAGVEFLFMLEGCVVYRHGDKNYRLDPGDALFFDAEAPHGPLELVTLPCRYLSIIASAE